MRRPHAIRALAGSLVGILILASGCTDFGPTAVNLASTKISSSKHPLVGTTAQVLTFGTARTAAIHASVIGPTGGTLEFEIGSITFPAGALSRPTRITAAIDGLSAAATFGPHGTVFPAGREPIIVSSGFVTAVGVSPRHRISAPHDDRTCQDV